MPKHRKSHDHTGGRNGTSTPVTHKSSPKSMHDQWLAWGFSEESAQRVQHIVDRARRDDRVLPLLPR